MDDNGWSIYGAERGSASGGATTPSGSATVVTKGVSATTASTPAFAWTRASRRPAADARIGRSAGVSAGQRPRSRNSTRSKSLERTTPGHDLSARGNVGKVDNSGWSLHGAQRSQPVATGSKRDGAENGSLKRKPLPSVAQWEGVEV